MIGGFISADIAQRQKEIEVLTATVQKVSDQMALGKPAPQLVANLLNSFVSQNPKSVILNQCTGLADSGIMPPMKYWEIVGRKVTSARAGRSRKSGIAENSTLTRERR